MSRCSKSRGRARAFAIVVSLHERGLYTRREWADALAARIAAAQATDDDVKDSYYRCWLAALEDLLAIKGIGSAAETARWRDAWQHAVNRTRMEGQSSCGPTISTSNRAHRRCARSPGFTLPTTRNTSAATVETGSCPDRYEASRVTCTWGTGCLRSACATAARCLARTITKSKQRIGLDAPDEREADAWRWAS